MKNPLKEHIKKSSKDRVKEENHERERVIKLVRHDTRLLLLATEWCVLDRSKWRV